MDILYGEKNGTFIEILQKNLFNITTKVKIYDLTKTYL